MTTATNGATHMRVDDGPFVLHDDGRRRPPAIDELPGPFVLPERPSRPPVTAVRPDRSRYAAWSDADDIAKGRHPREQVLANQSAGAAARNVVVYPNAADPHERIFVLQNFKIDSAVLRPEHRAYLDTLAATMANGKAWRVIAEAHASRTGTARHDDDLSEDRYLAARAYLEGALQRRGVPLERIGIAGEGVGFRHTSLPGEDPIARSVYVVASPLPAAHPPQPWPAQPQPPIIPPPVPQQVTTAIDPPRWAPIVRGVLSSHATLRTGNAVLSLVDGHATFLKMVEAIRTATTSEHYIYMLNGWELIDDFEMVPGDPSSTFQALMSSASSRGVQIRAMLWAKPKLGNYLQNRRIDALKTGASIRDDETLDHYIGGHHQKILVVKGSTGLIGFCGGLDINSDRVSVVGKTQGEPEHDVHAQIVGPAAFDVLLTFIRRWDHHPDSASINKRKGDLLGRAEPVPAARGGVSLGSDSSVPHTCSVAIARTFNPVTKGSMSPRERDIRNLFLAAIANARRFIYIEDQYMISLEAARALHAAVPRIAHLTILCAPSSSADVPCIWKFRRDFITTLTAGLSAADASKVRIFQRVSTPVSTPPTFGYHTYVHAKTWMVDDELCAVGSANVNVRGWEHDSEADAFIFDDIVPQAGTHSYCQQQRMALWSEHLGLPAATFADGVASAGHWLSRTSAAHVGAYDPLAGRDTLLGMPTTDAACDRSRAVVDPSAP